MSKLAELLAQAEKKPARPGRAIRRTFEFDRIKALPLRDWEDENLDEVARYLEDRFGTETRTLSLWRAQAAALAELAVYRFMLAPLGVGEGKAFVSVLASALVDAKRPMLFVPPDLRVQTREQVLPLLRYNFRFPEPMVVGSNELSLAKNAEMLNKIRPDCIVIDECHQWKNQKAGRVRRMERYIREHPETVVMALSGTITSKSIRDYWHILRWTHGERWMPLPANYPEVCDWSDALDPNVLPQDRVDPGVLTKLVEGQTDARRAFQKRLRNTPGVVASRENALGVSLYIRKRALTPPPVVRSALADLTAHWVTPGGEEFGDAKDLARAYRQIACGFYYKWDPAPPREWMSARSAWKKYVRGVLTHNRRCLDTELQVWNECERNNGPREWIEWKVIKDTFRPNKVTVWLDQFMAKDAADWARKENGIVWTEHTAFGEAIDLPYYGAGSELGGVTGPICASIRTHGTGKNLQETWSRNLVPFWPSSGKTCEQMIGRTHRHGQEADDVCVDTYRFCEGMRKAWNRSKEEATYFQETTGNAQKLLYANVDF